MLPKTKGTPLATGPNPNSSTNNQQQEIIRSERLAQARTFVDLALEEVAPSDRPELLRWIAHIGLVGLAATQGFKAAAAFAYREGDGLAVLA